MYAWAETETWEGLHRCFGGFGAHGSWQALFASVEVFRRLALQTALLWRYEYPAALDRRVSAYLEGLYDRDKI